MCVCVVGVLCAVCWCVCLLCIVGFFCVHLVVYCVVCGVGWCMCVAVCCVMDGWVGGRWEGETQTERDRVGIFVCEEIFHYLFHVSLPALSPLISHLCSSPFSLSFLWSFRSGHSALYLSFSLTLSSSLICFPCLSLQNPKWW